jgi:hypothetical protein
LCHCVVCMRISAFRRNMLPPFHGRLHAVSLKMDIVFSYETLIVTYQTTRRLVTFIQLFSNGLWSWIIIWKCCRRKCHWSNLKHCLAICQDWLKNSKPEKSVPERDSNWYLPNTSRCYWSDWLC